MHLPNKQTTNALIGNEAMLNIRLEETIIGGNDGKKNTKSMNNFFFSAYLIFFS